MSTHERRVSKYYPTLFRPMLVITPMREMPDALTIRYQIQPIIGYAFYRCGPALLLRNGRKDHLDFVEHDTRFTLAGTRSCGEEDCYGDEM